MPKSTQKFFSVSTISGLLFLTFTGIGWLSAGTENPASGRPLLNPTVSIVATASAPVTVFKVLADENRGPGLHHHRSTSSSGDPILALIDVNQATVEQLADALPGIGPAKAQRIVEWRSIHGPFQQLEQLLEVNGIGPKTLERIRPLIRIGDAVAFRAAILKSEQEEAAIRLRVSRIIALANKDALDP